MLRDCLIILLGKKEFIISLEWNEKNNLRLKKQKLIQTRQYATILIKEN